MAKPRKKYVPKRNFPGGGLLALLRIEARAENASPLRDDQLSDLGNGYWLAYTNLVMGNASEESWSCVVCALNIGLALDETVFDFKCEQEFVKALDGAFTAKIRAERHKSNSFRLDGQAMTDIKAALTIHDEQMRQAHRKEIVAAMELVQARIAAGNVYTQGEAA